MSNKTLLHLIVIAAFAFSLTIHADLIPTGNNPFYYKMGGGQEIAVPAYGGASSVPLHVEGDVGLGYNCGLFNPKLSITNSLNVRKQFVSNTASQLLENTRAEQVGSGTVQPSSKPEMEMQNGAVKNSDNTK